MPRSLPKHHLLLVQWLTLGFAVLIVGSAAGYDRYQERGRIEMREQERLLAISRVLQVNVEQNLTSINRVLAGLREELASGPVNARLGERLGALVEAMPSVRTIVMLDATGTARAASRPELVGNNFSQRDYFKAPLQHPDANTLFVSPPFSTSLGVFSIVVSRMISGPRGEFAGVITATLEPKYFDPLLDSVRYAPGMVAALHHGDGIVFLMSPHEKDEIVGMNLARPGSFFTRHKESRRNVSVYSGTVLATGDQRMLVQRTVQPADLNMDKAMGVAVSRPLDDIYASWSHDIRITGGLFVLTTLAFALGLYAYQCRLRQFILNETEAAKAMAQSEWNLKTIIEAEPECVKVLAPDGTLMQMNRAGLEMFEAESEEQVIGRTLVDLVAPEHRSVFNALNDRVNQGETGSQEFEIIGLKGGRRWLDMHAVPMRDANGQIAGLLGVTRDITERKKTEQELEKLARTDVLTGLANRRWFMALAEQELSRTHRYGGPLSVFMMDIDHFKNVNDTYGHQTGDLVLQKLGELCREALRDVDCVGRIGGEEFAVVLPQTDGARALEVAERVRQMVAHAEVAVERGLPVHFTLSIGVATLVGANTNIDTLLGQADGALYEAKRAGRNRVCVFGKPGS